MTAKGFSSRCLPCRKALRQVEQARRRWESALVEAGVAAAERAGWDAPVPGTRWDVRKLVTLIGAALALAVSAALMGVILSVGATLAAGNPLSIQGADLLQILRLIGGSVLTLLPFIGLTYLLAVWSRSTVTAIGGGIGFIIGESVVSQILGLMGGFWARLTLYLPGALAQQLAQRVAHGRRFVNRVKSQPVSHPNPPLSQSRNKLPTRAHARVGWSLFIFGRRILWQQKTILHNRLNDAVPRTY